MYFYFIKVFVWNRLSSCPVSRPECYKNGLFRMIPQWLQYSLSLKKKPSQKSFAPLRDLFLIPRFLKSPANSLRRRLTVFVEKQDTNIASKDWKAIMEVAWRDDRRPCLHPPPPLPPPPVCPQRMTTFSPARRVQMLLFCLLRWGGTFRPGWTWLVGEGGVLRGGRGRAGGIQRADLDCAG